MNPSYGLKCVTRFKDNKTAKIFFETSLIKWAKVVIIKYRRWLEWHIKTGRVNGLFESHSAVFGLRVTVSSKKGEESQSS